MISEVFKDERPRRRRRLLMYALARHSPMRPADVARRLGVSRAAVSLALRQLDDEARRQPALAGGLRRLADATAESASPRDDDGT